MIRFFWSRIVSRRTQAVDAEDSAEALVQQARQTGCQAKNLRTSLRALAKEPGFMAQTLPKLVVRLTDLRWSTLEIEKVLAYSDFYSGANERGYQRVMQQGLAREDYTVFMTACVFCYLADRFTEGAALLDVFQPDADPSTDWSEYCAFAGYIHVAAGRPLAQGLAYFDRALEIGSYSPLLAVNAYPLYFEAGQLTQCQTLHALMQRNSPQDPEVLYASACVELARNYYPEGFRLMEARYRMPEVARSMNASLLPKPRWIGQQITGKRLLVHGEQGLGDMVMMARYLPVLHAQGVELLMDCRAEALSLMACNFPYCHFFVNDLNQPIPEPFDYWTGLMSLPHLFNTTVFNVPATEGYLKTPDEQRAYWGERIDALAAGCRLRVGLTWSGNPGHRADKRRSMPFERVRPFIQQHPDVRFFSLQTHVPDTRPANLMDIADELLTMADTAAVIAKMDLIISVDTSAIHLAGAMGAPAWLLLPYRYEWRWGLQGQDNAWYDSVQVWRQPQSEAWDDVLTNVSAALEQYVETGVQ